MKPIKETLDAVLNEMQTVDENLCCAVYIDDYNPACAIVMFMEYGGYGTMHAVMKDLHARLSEKMGHPVSLCHNHPTDENILIHSAPSDAAVYYSDACCKEDTIRCCMDYLEKRDGYRDEYQAMAKAAECLADGLDKSPQYILEVLNWDKDPMSQLIQALIDYHN